MDELTPEILEKFRIALWSEPVIKPSDDWTGWKIYCANKEESSE